MKRSQLLLFVFILLTINGFRLEAQPNTFYFMKGLPQTKELNPSRAGVKNGFYISMPLISAVDISLNTNNWSVNDLIRNGTGLQKDSMVYDLGNLISKFGTKNFLFETTSWTLIDFGWKKKNKAYSFSISEHLLIEPFVSQDFANLVFYGNEKYMGSAYNSGNFGLSAMHYRQFAFNFSKDLNSIFTIGGTGKVLFGMAGVHTSGLNISTYMPSSGERVNLSAGGTIHMSAPVIITQNPTNDYNFNTQGDFSALKYLLNFSNPGFALDLGVTAKINKKLDLSMSLIDIGLISWSDHVTNFTGQGSFTYQGINLNDPSQKPPTTKLLTPLVHQLRDSIVKAFPLDLNTSKFYSLLPFKLYLGAEYRLSNKFTLGGLARVRMFNNMFHTSGTASLNMTVRRNLSLTAAYSILESTYTNIGAGILLRAGFFQIYGATDNLLAPFYPLAASNISIRLGVNLMFEEIDRITKRNHQYIPTTGGRGRK
ncbi:MAG: DUF5723 family protein [Prolixibacteraceae bacterium]